MSNASIGYRVPLIPQTTDMSCWAAGIAMIVAWQRRMSIDPSQIAANPGGDSYLDQFKDGLNPNDTSILQKWGFATEPPQSYTPAAFGELLRRYGPLWVGAAVPGPHIRVITGFQPADPEIEAIVGINDPWESGMRDFRPSNRGSSYTRTYSQLMGEITALAWREMREPAPVYVAHLS